MGRDILQNMPRLPVMFEDIFFFKKLNSNRIIFPALMLKRVITFNSSLFINYLTKLSSPSDYDITENISISGTSTNESPQ